MTKEDVIYGLFVGGAVATIANKLSRKYHVPHRIMSSLGDLTHIIVEDESPDFIRLKSCRYFMPIDELQEHETKALRDYLSKMIEECIGGISESGTSTASAATVSSSGQDDIRSTDNDKTYNISEIVDFLRTMKDDEIPKITKYKDWLSSIDTFTKKLEAFNVSIQEDKEYNTKLKNHLSLLHNKTDALKHLLPKTCLNDDNIIIRTKHQQGV